MKKLVLSAAIALIATGAFAQNKIKEGTIVYSAEYTLPAGMEAMASQLPKELTVYFKGDSAVSVQKMGMANINMITNKKTDYMRLLLDIPVAGKKYSVKFTPADQEMMSDKFPEWEATAGTETKTIGAYKVQKYTLKDKKSGKEFEGWFTKDIDVPVNSFTMLFDPSYGVPVEFSSIQNGVTSKLTVKELKEGPVPANSFTAGNDFEEITAEQLQAMQGGRR
ncbi:MAG: hypothetical protein K0S09_2656 [Sphingobacteriaceae bacterium]|jgi:hypothetical protein|nr:hypothetical protein [Sphingobacteriaceae bacterium]